MSGRLQAPTCKASYLRVGMFPQVDSPPVEDRSASKRRVALLVSVLYYAN